MAKVNKTRIYERLLKNASEIWGLKDKDIAHLDPAMKMILGACAKEFEKLEQRLTNSESRIMSRLTDFLLPDIYTGIKPAHTVIQCTPVEPGFSISPFDTFYLEETTRVRPGSREEVTTRTAFSPIGRFECVKGKTKVILSENGIHSILGSGAKENLISRRFSIDKNSCWLGVELPLGMNEVHRMSFFFDWINHPEKDALFDWLEFVEVSNIQDDKLKSYHGIPRQSGDVNSPFTLLESKSKLLENEAHHYYNKRYVTVELDPEQSKLLGRAPAALELTDLEDLEEPDNLYWLQFSFPAQFSSEQVLDVDMSINCFPAIDRELVKQPFRLRHDFNIKAVQTDSNFLEVESLYSEEGEQFRENPSIDLESSNKGCFTMRYGGVGRFDQRSAIELISHTLDQVKDEVQAFSAIDLDSFVSELRSVKETVGRIENETTKIEGKSSVPFIVIYPFRKDQKAQLSYWITQGAEANGLRIGTGLDATDPNSFENGIGTIRSESIGGSDRRDSSNKINQLKRSILSRGRMVTKKDLEWRCNELLKEYVDDISIVDGVTTSNAPGEGLIRTIDVVVKKKSGVVNPEVWGELCHQVEFSIRNESNFSLPVRIIKA